MGDICTYFCANITHAQKSELLDIYSWPSVSTDKLGKSSMITHRIYSMDEVLVRKKKAYPSTQAAISGGRDTQDAGFRHNPAVHITLVSSTHLST